MGEGKIKKAWDAPRDGWVRYTVYVNEELLNRFKELAWSNGDSLVEAVNEAFQEWVSFREKQIKGKL